MSDLADTMSRMTASWRDGVPEHAQRELEECFGVALDMAVHLLGKRGEFFPVGSMMPADTRQAVLFAVADDSLGEHPESQAVLDELYAVATAQSDSMVAVAFASDVRLVDGGDAVRVEVEHVEGPALEIVVPYRRSRFRRTVSMGEMSVSPGTRRL